MAFDGIVDKNAQRAEATAVQGLQVSGQSSNQTLEGMGLKTVSSATQTAKALSALAQDLVGSAGAIQQKEGYLEAYANAGAGRSIKELRAERPAWESLFGPSATVQGAQARALKTATAEIGNDAISMVDQNSDKDPAEFHKLLAQRVSSHLTGDSITDTLITQESADKITEVAALHYKAHAKYVQNLNLETANHAIDVEVDTLDRLRQAPKDQRSPEGIAKQEAKVLALLMDSSGQDPDSHREMVSVNIAKALRNGNATAYNLIQGNYSFSVNQDTHIQAGADKFLQGKSDAIEATLKDGNMPDNLNPDYGVHLKFTPKQLLDQHAGLKTYYDIIEQKHSLEAAVFESDLVKTVKAGAIPHVTLLGKLSEGHSTYPKLFTTEKMASILVMQAEGAEKQQKEEAQFNGYIGPERMLNPADQEAGRRLFKARQFKNHPGDPITAQRLIDQDWAVSPYGPDKDLTNQLDDAFTRPFLPGGKPDPAFDAAWEHFKTLYKLNDVRALQQVSSPVVAARLHNAMVMIDNGLMDDKGAKAQWALSADLDARDITRNPDELKKLDAKVSELTKGNLTRFLPLVETGGVVKNIGSVRHEITQLAGGIYQYNGVSAESAFEKAGSIYAATHENVAGTSVKNGGTPLAQQMGIVDNYFTADYVVKNLLKEQNIPNANVQILNGVMILTPADKNGIATGAKSIQISLKGLGKKFNTDVAVPKRKAADDKLERGADAKLASTIDAMIAVAARNGETITRDTALARINRQRAEETRINNEAAADITRALKGEITGPKGEVYELHPGIKEAIGIASKKIKGGSTWLSNKVFGDIFK